MAEISGGLYALPTSGYRGEEKVAPDSWTETFVVAKLEIDNWRWAGTPFYLRHGKRLPRRITEIAIQNARQFTRLLTREGVAVKAVS